MRTPQEILNELGVTDDRETFIKNMTLEEEDFLMGHCLLVSDLCWRIILQKVEEANDENCKGAGS